MPLRKADVDRHSASKEIPSVGQSNDLSALIANAASAQDSAAGDAAADSNDPGYYVDQDDDFGKRQYATEEWENPQSDDYDELEPSCSPESSLPLIYMQQATRNGLKFTPLDRLLIEAPEEVPYVVENLLPLGGTSILAGEPKAGKSTLARSLALIVAEGGDFLGRKCNAGYVLYLVLEDKRDEVRKHFASMSAGVTTNLEKVLVHTGPAPALSDDGLRELRLIIERYKPVLVVIDVVHRFLRVNDMNDYAKVSTALEPLTNLARETNCHILMVHHAGKGAHRQGLDRVLGSTALAGAVDTAMIFSRIGDQRFLEVSHFRYGEAIPKTLIVRSPDTLRITSGGEHRAGNHDQIRHRILELLKSGEMTQEAIRGAVGGDTSRTSAVLREMAGAREVIESGTGKRGSPYKYSLPDAT